MLKGEQYTLKVEKMVNGGFGLSRIDNIPVFIDGACPGDLLKVEISKINKNYIVANIIDIAENSKSRIKPLCPFHKICGSCNWLHINYNEQLIQKQIILKETLKKIACVDLDINPTIPSPIKSGYRCKIQLPFSQRKVSKKLLSGYYKKNSHELINIKNCPMHPDKINEINEFIKSEAFILNISAYDEISHKGLIRHVIYRMSSDLSQILIIFVINSNAVTPELVKLSRILTDKYNNICGICANFNTQKTNVIMSQNTVTICGENYYTQELDNVKYKVSANSFFQVNPLCATNIFSKVKEIISSRIKSPLILDAYSGVSSFGIWLSSIASKVVCIEEVKSASDDAAENIKLNNISNIEIINGDAEIEFKKLIKDKIKFDVSIVDPPRKGCSQSAINYLMALTSKYIVYVSCNPSTLARDMKILKENGFMPEYVQPVDMFPNTFHIETVCLFSKIISKNQ